MSDSFDVIVVGAGIAGTTSAYYLAKRGARVLVLEKGEVAGEQSSRNWGFVRQQGRDPAEIPLMMQSNEIWRGLERELNADLEWIQGGNLITFADERERRGWEKWLETARGFGLDSRLLERAEIDEVVPGNGFECLGAVFTESDGQAEPRKVTAAFRRAAEGRGVEFRTRCAGFEILTEGGAVSGVASEQGVFRAPAVVCAAGVWSSRLLRGLGLKLPQVWIRGSVARTTPAPPLNHPAVWTGVGYRQRGDGTMNVATRSADHDLTIDSLLLFSRYWREFRANRGAISLHLNRLFFDTFWSRFSKRALARELTRHRTFDPEPNHATLARVLDQLRRIVPAARDVEIDFTWAGYIDMTPDMLPAIDRLRAPDGLVLATGFSGHGFGMGPIVGRLVSELILDPAPSLDLHAFRFSRFSDGSKLVPHAIV